MSLSSSLPSAFGFDSGFRLGFSGLGLAFRSGFDPVGSSARGGASCDALPTRSPSVFLAVRRAERSAAVSASASDSDLPFADFAAGLPSSSSVVVTRPPSQRGRFMEDTLSTRNRLEQGLESPLESR